MRVYALRRVLKEFAQEARQGKISTETGEGSALADLAEQLESRISRDQTRNVIKSDDTISSAPTGTACPCCGK